MQLAGQPDRECEDHVFVTYEFPGKNHASDKDDVVVVTYSSVSTNSFEPYGECVMGSRGTMVVEMEQSLMLYYEKEPGAKGGAPRATAVTVTSAGGGKPVLDASSSVGGAVAAKSDAGPAGTTGGVVSRGYREEMEDFAFCVRLWDARLGYKETEPGKYVQRLPRCHGEVAMADAIVALSANRAMKNHERIVFKDTWFKADSAEVPDTDAKPKVPVT